MCSKLLSPEQNGHKPGLTSLKPIHVNSLCVNSQRHDVKISACEKKYLPEKKLVCENTLDVCELSRGFQIAAESWDYKFCIYIGHWYLFSVLNK